MTCWSAGIPARMSAKREKTERAAHALRARMPALRQVSAQTQNAELNA
jgi:hypothetical protein